VPSGLALKPPAILGNLRFGESRLSARISSAVSLQTDGTLNRALALGRVSS
jgi:hypothetical protein